MLNRTQVPHSSFLDIVTWCVTVVGGFGVGILTLQIPLVLFTNVFKPVRPYWAFTAAQSTLLLIIGLGLRSRKPWARIAFLAELSFAVLLTIYWSVAIATRRMMPLVPAAFVQDDESQLPALTAAFFCSLAYAWIGVRFLRSDIAAQFRRPEA